MKLLLLTSRFLLGALLLYSGLGEVRHPFDFLASVNAYQLTGPALGVVVAAVVPWLELTAGVCLLAGVFTRGAFAAAVLLMGIFSVAIGSAWYRGLAIGCGCFGGSGGSGVGEIIGALTFFRSLFLMALAVAGAALETAHNTVGAAPIGDMHARAGGRRRPGRSAGDGSTA